LTTPTIPPTSWIDPRIEVRASSIQGRGMFATQPIRAGEVVIIWGGVVFTRAEIAAGRAQVFTVAPLDDDLYLGDPADGPENPDYYLNHACDPNVWMQDAITLIARRDIAPGEELTADYALWEADEDWRLPGECTCGSLLCRRTITGRDWRLKDLQTRYAGHFSPLINRRIARITRF
jgi:hypothetical protein